MNVEAAGVNFRDIYERKGGGAYEAETPHLAGVEGAGTVVGTGERVAWSDAQGSYAEQVVVRADAAVPVPDGITTEVAAAAMLQGSTAHYLAHEHVPRPARRHRDRPRRRRRRRAAADADRQAPRRARHRDHLDRGEGELARAAGADETIGYEGFAERARELTGGEGVAAVYDGIGAATFDESLAALRPRGYMVLYGAASGQPPPVEIAKLNASSLFLTRPTLANYGRDGDELRMRAADFLGWIAAGELDVRIGGRYPLEDAAQAQADLASRGTTGKLILTP